MNRHGRQIRLREVGPSGQLQIGRASVDVPLSGIAAEVAVRYLAGAGVGVVRVRDRQLAELAGAIDPAVEVEVDARLEASDVSTTFGLQDPASRDVALGAFVALRALRCALRGDRAR